MPNPLTIADAADLVDVAIQKIWLKDDRVESRFFEQYINVETGVSDYYMKDSSLSGIGAAGRIVEGGSVISQSPVQGYDKTYTQLRQGVLLPITWEMWRFGIQKRKLTAVVEQTRKAVETLREELCAARVDNGFSTSYSVSDPGGNYAVTITGGNGVALFSASQTREDGGTNNNNIIYDGTTYNMDLDYDALKAAHRTASLIRTPVGKPMNINLDTIMVSRGNANEYRAREILKTIQKGDQPATADREGPGTPAFKIIANPYLTTNTGYWFMCDSSMKNPIYGLQYKESEPIHIEPVHVVYKTQEMQYQCFSAFDLGFNDYRGWVGSQATNSA